MIEKEYNDVNKIYGKGVVSPRLVRNRLPIPKVGFDHGGHGLKIILYKLVLWHLALDAPGRTKLTVDNE